MFDPAKQPTIRQLSSLLKARKLQPLTCVAMAKRAIEQGRGVPAVLTILSVDADKIRPLSRTLYEYIENR